MLRYYGFEVAYYVFTLRCLAYENLRPVQDSGSISIPEIQIWLWLKIILLE
jgi:hypothetical protein